MRIVFIIFGMIALVGTILCAGLLTASNAHDASELADLDGNPFGSLALAMVNMPSKGDFQMGMVIAGLLTVSGIFGIVATFMKKKIVGLIGAGLVVLFGLALIIFQPSVPTAELDPKSLGIVTGIMAIVGGACIFGVHQMNKPPA